MSIKNIVNANKNARQNAQLKKSNKLKTGLAATGATTTVAGGIFGFFYSRRLMKKHNDEISNKDNEIAAAKAETAKIENKIQIQSAYIKAEKDVDIKCVIYDKAKEAAKEAATNVTKATEAFNTANAPIAAAKKAAEDADNALKAAKTSAGDNWNENTEDAKKLIAAVNETAEKVKTLEATTDLGKLTDALSTAKTDKTNADYQESAAKLKYEEAAKAFKAAEKAYNDLIEAEKKEREEAEKAKAESEKDDDKKDDDKKDDDKKNKKKK